jgi:hypothetical protein
VCSIESRLFTKVSWTYFYIVGNKWQGLLAGLYADYEKPWYLNHLSQIEALGLMLVHKGEAFKIIALALTLFQR